MYHRGNRVLASPGSRGKFPRCGGLLALPAAEATRACEPVFRQSRSVALSVQIWTPGRAKQTLVGRDSMDFPLLKITQPRPGPRRVGLLFSRRRCAHGYEKDRGCDCTLYLRSRLRTGAKRRAGSGRTAWRKGRSRSSWPTGAARASGSSWTTLAGGFSGR